MRAVVGVQGAAVSSKQSLGGVLANSLWGRVSAVACFVVGLVVVFVLTLSAIFVNAVRPRAEEN